MQLYAKYGGTKRAQCAPIPQTGFEEKVHTPCEQSFWPRTGAGKKLLQVVAVLCRGRNLLLIGIILCAEKDHIDVELALQDVRKPIAVSDYDLIVPRRELQQLVLDEIAIVEGLNETKQEPQGETARRPAASPRRRRQVPTPTPPEPTDDDVLG